jgi:RNA polymerase sigma factor (sigma-70 family)
MSPGGLPRLPLVQSDQRLLALARDGDERAFEAIVRRYRRPLLRYCRRMGLSDSRAEDVVQQALMRAWIALGRGGEVHAPKAWLYRTVHNTAVNSMRSARELGPLDDGSFAELAPSAETDFEHRTALRQTLSDVTALPQMQREAILRTAIDGHSHEEIASALGVTHGAVRGLLYRARATLRDAAAAVAPQPLLLWASGLLGRMSPTAGRLAELSAPAGSADLGGALAKGAALAATAAVLAVGTGIVPLPRHLAHRSKAAVLALGISPATAEAQASEPSGTPGPAGPLRGATSQAGSPTSQGRRGSAPGPLHFTSHGHTRRGVGVDGVEHEVGPLQEDRTSGSGRGQSEDGAAHDREGGSSAAPRGPGPPPSESDGRKAPEAETTTRLHGGEESPASSVAPEAPSDPQQPEAAPMSAPAGKGDELAAEPLAGR